jgi:hypothetical protein
VRQSKWLLFYLINLIFACPREICGLVFAGLSCLIHNLLWNEGQIHQQLIEPSGEISQESTFRRMRTGIPSRKSLEIDQPNFRIQVIIIVRVNPSCKNCLLFSQSGDIDAGIALTRDEQVIDLILGPLLKELLERIEIQLGHHIIGPGGILPIHIGEAHLRRRLNIQHIGVVVPRVLVSDEDGKSI